MPLELRRGWESRSLSQSTAAQSAGCPQPPRKRPPPKKLLPGTEGGEGVEMTRNPIIPHGHNYRTATKSSQSGVPRAARSKTPPLSTSRNQISAQPPIRNAGRQSCGMWWNVYPFSRALGQCLPLTTTKLINEIQMQTQSASCPRSTHQLIPETAMAQKGCPGSLLLEVITSPPRV